MKKVLRLSEAAATDAARQVFAKDMAASIDECVKGVTGLKGMFIRNSYKLVKSVRPGYIEHILFVMSDDFIHAYEPLHDRYREGLTLPAEKIPPFGDYLARHKDEAYEAFIGVSDRYAASRAGSVVEKAYTAFRSQIRQEFPLALPYMARVIEKHTLVDADNKAE